MECLLINDGSTDQSREICEEYIKKDNRFVLFQQKNAGVSAARNAGINQAIGDYIFFLDADDIIIESQWNELLRELKEGKKEFVAFCYKTLNLEGKERLIQYPMRGTTLEDRETIIEFMLASSQLNTCWGKLFLRRVIQENHIRFRTDLPIGEDFVFVAQYVQVAKSYKIMNVPIIYYRQHVESAMKRYDTGQQLGYLKELYQYNLASVEQIGEENLRQKMYIHYLRTITNLILQAAKGKKRKELRRDIRYLLEQDYIQDILDHVNQKLLPSKMKYMEYRLLTKQRLTTLTVYFRLKSQFAG